MTMTDSDRTHCRCGTTLEHAPAIGPYCPNSACEIGDGPFDDDDATIGDEPDDWYEVDPPTDCRIRRSGTCDDATHGDRRQQLPYVIEWVCPECGADRTHDLNSSCLLTPRWGEPTIVSLFCTDCDVHEPTATVQVIPDVTLRLSIVDTDHAHE